jgi:hypothetical protein
MDMTCHPFFAGTFLKSPNKESLCPMRLPHPSHRRVKKRDSSSTGKQERIRQAQFESS